MGTPTARYPLMDCDPRAAFGEDGPNAYDVDDQAAFHDHWSHALMGADFYRQYMVEHEVEMPVRWDTLEPTMEVMVREGDAYTVVATFSWVRTVIEDDISVECYDCGEDGLHVASVFGHFLLAGEGENNVHVGHWLALQFMDILLGMGYTVTVHAIV